MPKRAQREWEEDIQNKNEVKFLFLSFIKRTRLTLSPNYLSFIHLFKICICLRKWSWTKKTSIRWKRWWMRRCEYQVFSSIDERFFCYSIRPPEYKNNMLSLLWQRTDSSIGKVFPSLSLMGIRFSLSNCENCIQQKYSLFCPISKISTRTSDSEITLQLGKNISQRWLYAYTNRNRERKSHSSSWCMVRVLPQYHDFHSIKWR